MELKNLGQTAASALIHMDIRLEREHWTMFRQKLFGIAAAAALGSAAMLGSTAAYAIKVCDDTAPTDRATLMACPDSSVYAAEMLLEGDANATAAKDTSDTTVYYNIGDVLVLAVPADIGAATVNDGYLVSITLDGMVFQSAASLAGGTGATYQVITGGAIGDDEVLFRLTAGSINAATDNLSVTASYAVSAGGGSAELTMTNQALQTLNLNAEATHSGNVIMVAPALNEVATKVNPVADVAADGFMQFVGATAGTNANVATVGSLMVGVTTGDDVRRAPADGTDVTALATVVDSGTSGTPAMPNSTVTFSGDVSFASKVYLHGDNDCGVEPQNTGAANIDTQTEADEADIRMIEGTGDDAVVTGITAQNVTEFATAQFLCIMVDPEADDAMRIPATSAYTAMGSYMGIANADIGPMPEEQTLGMIERNGTTVRLPYLSTHAKFHQRLRLVNRGSAPVKYEMEFHGDGDVAGMGADGELPAGITVLSLSDPEGHVVTPGNGNNTSGTLIIEAQPGMIDVATILVTRATGASDTVVYSP